MHINPNSQLVFVHRPVLENFHVLFIAQYLKSYSQRLRVRARCTSDSRHLGIIFKFHCIDLLPLDRGGVLYSPLLLQPARLTKDPNLPARAVMLSGFRPCRRGPQAASVAT